jgi:hypothetical protein
MTQIATATTFRVIYTCRNKSCKHIFAFDYSIEGTDLYGLPYGTRELKAGEVQSRYDHQGRRSHSADVMGDLRCPECGCNLPKSNRVEGHYSEKHVCGAKCMGAKGPNCDCQCGGANHGANYL